MNDETKAAKAIEWLRTVDQDDDDYEDLNTILIHIDGEDARRDAAIADAIARVVADLRARAAATRDGLPDNVSGELLDMANRYERGEHKSEGAIPNILIFGFPPVNP